MTIGLSRESIESLVREQLLAGGRYTLTEPSGKPIFTSEQRDAIARAVSQVVAENNASLLEQLRKAGVSGL